VREGGKGLIIRHVRTKSIMSRSMGNAEFGEGIKMCQLGPWWVQG
jgi:hypothetical protein